MQPARTKIIIGAFIIAVAVEMITDPPWFISWPLLGVGIFILGWGVAPRQVLGFISSMPLGHPTADYLIRLDHWVMGSASLEQFDAGTAQALQDLYQRGLEFADKSRVGIQEIGHDAWIKEVTKFLSENVSSEAAYVFGTECAKLSANYNTEFIAKVQTLRTIVANYLARESKT